MAYEKQQNLVIKLAKLTQTGSVDWQQTLDDTVFRLSFKNNSILISLADSKDDTADVIISLLNESGQIVERFSDNDLRGEGISQPVEGGWFKFMLNMYEKARRSALGSDQVLDSIIKEIDSIK